MKTIRVAKLISGEMVIGHYQDEDQEFIREVYAISIRAQQAGGYGVSIIPYMVPFSDQAPDIDASTIICEVPAQEELEKMYLEQISGLIIPNQKVKV